MSRVVAIIGSVGEVTVFAANEEGSAEVGIPNTEPLFISLDGHFAEVPVELNLSHTSLSKKTNFKMTLAEGTQKPIPGLHEVCLRHERE